MQVVLEHVAKTYPGGIAAVADVCLEVADGELMVIVGPSGCGKTTLLRLIAGLETADHGTIRIGSRVVNHVPPKDRDVAMVFQHPALYPHLTVAKNLAFSLRLRGTARAEIDRRVSQAAESLGIGSLLARRPGELSGGQQQRVALGRAIVRRPACFLLDEPLSSLDPALRADMRMELKRLHRELGATILYVTHDQEEAMTLGDRVVVLHDGCVQQIGEPMEIYRSPANRFVAGFFGSLPMNLLDGTIVEEHGRFWFHHERLKLPLSDTLVKNLGTGIHGHVTLGIRPEDIHAAGSLDDAAVIHGRVVTIEPLGDRTHVHLAVGAGSSLVACFGAEAHFKIGASLSLRLDLDRAKLFP